MATSTGLPGIAVPAVLNRIDHADAGLSSVSNSAQIKKDGVMPSIKPYSTFSDVSALPNQRNALTRRSPDLSDTAIARGTTVKRPTAQYTTPFGTEASEKTNIVELLRKDHEKVKMLFREFESAAEADEKQTIVRQAIAELEIHAFAEKKIFYPAVREDWPDAAPDLDESFEEHHVMKFLIGELRDMSSTDERFDAKFTVLAENVKHHIKEEEAELFARARAGRLDLSELGTQLVKAKASFQSKQKKTTKKATSKRKPIARGASFKKQTAKKSKKRPAA